ncbi:MAG TPA: PQQ-binding-like beta-propeller repeat protein [Verrucomicrobiota bacterium]|nr:PQQ-binding-like beta-propeller repeat protein [Verrucomicrobiota bacterium]HQL77262.1 PQQ-binding-like beta-propeller repeat protein [Verrucomicrobiota bacterium]
MKLSLGAMVVLAASALFAADWPQWRGPARDGVSAEQVSAAWPADGPKLLWRAAVGTGFSSISVSEGRAYTLGNTNKEDTVWCFEASSGKPLWQHSYASELGPQHYEGGPGSTPTVHRGRVFTISKWGDVFCLDAAKGTVIWQRDLRQEGVKPNRWGFAGSPLIWGDKVILNAGAAGIALNRDTGRIVWSSGTNVAGYASPTRFASGGRECVLMFAAKHLVALDPQNGRELWRQFWETGWDTNNADPLVHGGRIFLSSFSRGCGLFSVRQDAPEVVYTNNAMHIHLSPGVVIGDYLYAFNGEAKRDTDLRCLHLPSGELKWARKDPDFGSLIRAGDTLIILSHKGELLLAEASPADFKPLARAKVLSGLCWTPPALANGRLYVRNARGELRCLEVPSR